MMSKYMKIAAGATLLLAATSTAEVVVDGDASDWPAASRVYPPFYEPYDPVSHDALFMVEQSGYLYFLIQARSGEVDAQTPLGKFSFTEGAIYLNVDQDPDTGFKGVGWAPRGVDLTIMPAFQWWPEDSLVDNKVNVYQGCPRVSCPASSLLFSVDGAEVAALNTGDHVGYEFRLSKAALEQASGKTFSDLDVALSTKVKTRGTNTAVDVDVPFTFQNWYTFYSDVLSPPSCSKPAGSLRAAVIFSNNNKAKFFQDKAYSQLYMSMQYQLYQAGIPFDRRYDTDLIDIQKMCAYDVLVIPFLAFAEVGDMPALRRALFYLIHFFGVGVVTSGNFLTNDAKVGWGKTLPGDPYFTMKTLLGVNQDFPVFAETEGIEMYVSDASPMFKGFSVGQVVMDSELLGTFTNMYIPLANSLYDVKVITKQRQTVTEDGSTKVKEYNGILKSRLSTNMYGRTSGAVIHFSTLEMLANTDLVWRAARYLVTEVLTAQGKSPVAFGLMMSRFNHLLTYRVDCDQSMLKEEVPTLYPYMLAEWTEAWYQKYNFVSSYYVNIGNDPANYEETIWPVSKTFYNFMLERENEIGSHSYTHPHNISDPKIDLQFEFQQSMNVLKQKLNLPRCASAQPGATEELWVAKEMEKYMADTYFSGGYSGVKAGYPGCFGFLDPDSPMVYVAPNIFFDFTLMGFLKYTAEEASAFWQNQLTDTSKYANQFIIHWPGHDYAAGNWGYGPNDDLDANFNQGPGYTQEMFEDFIKRTFEMGTEFLTTMDLSDRIRAFTAANLQVEETANPNVYTVTASAPMSLGRLALEVVSNDSNNVIQKAGTHYAFNDRFVFLPMNGGSFEVEIGTSSPSIPVTHIDSLPMRAELISIIGDNKDLTATFAGRGEVSVVLSPEVAFESYVFSGSTEGNGAPAPVIVKNSQAKTVVFKFTTVGVHTLSITTQ